jgi:hypothetical protein
MNTLSQKTLAKRPGTSGLSNLGAINADRAVLAAGDCNFRSRRGRHSLLASVLKHAVLVTGSKSRVTP